VLPCDCLATAEAASALPALSTPARDSEGHGQVTIVVVVVAAAAGGGGGGGGGRKGRRGGQRVDQRGGTSVRTGPWRSVGDEPAACHPSVQR